jgi:MarR family transcriptional regulator for hemolysin
MAKRPPVVPPLGLRLSRTARALTNEFERAMAEAGGSASLWQVLVLVRSNEWGKQSELADAMGITSATLTHHLNALERQGLLRRWREPDDRRSQRVELTADGQAMFDRLRSAAMRHDERLRAPFSDEEVEQLAGLLDRLRLSVEN